MRDCVVDVRATTLREFARVVVPRDTTFRFAFIARDAVSLFTRDAAFVVPRDTIPRDALVVPATRFVVRATVSAETPRFTVRPAARFVAFVRGDALG